MLNKGTTAILVFFVIYGLIAWVGVRRMRQGRHVPIRRLPGLDAVDEAVGRATELGRPFMAVVSQPTPYMNDEVIAGIEVVRYAARTAAKYEASFVAIASGADSFAVLQDSVRAAFSGEGKPDLYREDMVRFIGGYSMVVYGPAVIALMEELKIAADLLTGYLGFQTLMLAEAGASLGAIQIGATKQTAQLPFIAASCDYTLMGEELYATAAYISRDPVSVGFLVAQEFGKCLCCIVVVVGVLLSTFGGAELIKLLER